MNVTTRTTSSAVLPPNASEGIAVGFFGHRTYLPKGTSSVHPLAHVLHVLSIFLLIFLFFKRIDLPLIQIDYSKKKKKKTMKKNTL